MNKIILYIFLLFISLGYSQIFFDNVSNDIIGEFPNNWDLINGIGTVDQKYGYKFINLTQGGTLKPIVNEETKNYINGDFTVEFDILFDKASSLYTQSIHLRLWDGAYGYQNGPIRYKPFVFYRDGLETDWNHPEIGNTKNHSKDLQTLDPIWRHVKVECISSKLKILIDDNMVLFLPRFKMQPTMVSIGGYTTDSRTEAKLGFTNFSVINHNQIESNQPHTESEIISNNPHTTDSSDIGNTNNDNASNGSTNTGQISSTINTPIGITTDTSIDEDVKTNTFEPVNTSTTNPELINLELADEKPIYKLKVTLTDLLCIKKRNNIRQKADYRFIQVVEYYAKYRISGETKLGYIRAFDYTFGNYNIKPDRVHLGKGQISLIETGKRESNIMNSLVFELRQTNVNDKSASFLINSLLIDVASSSLNEDKRLYYGDTEVEIYDILSDLILLKEGKQLSGYSVPYHDPEIMKAQYGLFKTFDSGPNGKLWVRQVGKTLEGAISLGNTTSNNGLRGASWIKFELLDY